MFEWKVEEMRLMNEKKDVNGTYFLEESVSEEDKIAFVDSMQDGELSYIIELIQKFESERDSMPKDQWGHVKTVSLKAWLKRNDLKGVCDRDYRYGRFLILGIYRYIQFENTLSKKESYLERYDSLIDEAFYRQLLECEKLEKKYFLEHDEYSILKRHFLHLEVEYKTSFGVRIKDCSDGKVFIYDKEDDQKQREITIEELKILISMYDRLEMFIQELSNEINIKY